jgi:hypothetical protein
MTIVKIEHAQFLYYEESGSTTDPETGEEVPLLAARFARYGQTVDIPRDEDYQRGEKFGAFADPSEAEAEAVEEELSDDDDSGEDDDEVDIESHDELVAWIRDEKPTAKAVVRAAGNNPEHAKKLMVAENEASGSQPRKSVMDPLRKIAGE